MKGLHSTCENRRVDGVEAPDADVTDLVDARRDGADRQQFLQVVDPVVAHADRAAEPLRPQRLERPILLEALARVRRVDQVQINILQSQLAQRVSTSPNDRSTAKAMAREEFRRHPHVLSRHVGPLFEKYSQRVAHVLLVPVDLGRVDMPVAAAQRVQHCCLARAERRLPHAETEAGHFAPVVQLYALLADCASCHGAAAAKTHAWWAFCSSLYAAAMAGSSHESYGWKKLSALAAAVKIGSNAAVLQQKAATAASQCVCWC